MLSNKREHLITSMTSFSLACELSAQGRPSATSMNETDIQFVRKQRFVFYVPCIQHYVLC